LLARNSDFISFFLGFFWHFSFFGAKEKPRFMVMGNRDFTSFFHEFCSWFRFFCSWLLSLSCIFFAWQEKRDLLSFFLRFFFTVGYFLSNSSLSLSLSLSKEKSGFGKN